MAKHIILLLNSEDVLVEWTFYRDDFKNWLWERKTEGKGVLQSRRTFCTLKEAKINATYYGYETIRFPKPKVVILLLLSIIIFQLLINKTA